MRSPCVRNCLRVLFFIAIVLLVSTAAICQQTGVSSGNSSEQAQALGKFRSLNRPLTFEVNQGQADGRVRFLSRGAGYELFLTADEAVMSLAKPSPSATSGPNQQTRLDAAETLRLKLAGANPKATIIGEGELAGKSNYYIGNDRSQWRAGVSNYSSVRYQSIYPGIDLVYYGNQQVLEHDFVVAPGADPRHIRLALAGAKSVRVDEKGDLVLGMDGGSIRLLKPIVYQQIDGKRRNVEGQFVLRAHKVAGFQLGKYDKRRELVIDPQLSYSTYIGGSFADEVKSIAVSGTTVYVTGFTFSADFPVTSGVCINCGGFEDVFVSAFTVNGAFVYSTYLGGHGTNEPRGIAVDATGNAYVGGYTEAKDYPIASSGLSTTSPGGTFDGFISLLSASGTLTRSGYFGGKGEEQILGLAFDPSTSHVIASGYTTSTDFPDSTGTPVSGQLYKTSNAASTWSLSSGIAPTTSLGGMDVLTFLIVPGSLAPSKYYAGGTMGVYTSSDGLTWSALNTGFNHNRVTCLVDDPTTTGSLYACTDAGVFKFNPTLGQWTFLSSIDAGNIQLRALLVDQTTHTTVYAATSFGVYVSTDSGNTWTASNLGFGNTNVFSLMQDASGNLYAGTAGDGTNPTFYQSIGASSWSAPNNTGLPSPVVGFFSNSLTYDPASGKIYAGISQSGGFVTSNGGSTWAALGSQLTGASANVETFAIDPATNTTIYAATDDGLWKSVDSGATFARSDAGYTATTVRALAVDKQASLQAGTTVLYGGVDTDQGFVATFTNTLALLTSNPIGGDGSTAHGGTHANSVAVDNSGNFYVAGDTPATIPNTQLGAQPARAGSNDGFLMAFNSGGASLWSTYVGGTQYDSINSVAVSGSDASVVIGGYTESYFDFPTLTPFQNSCNRACGFLAKYTAASGTKKFATFYGTTTTWVQAVGVNQTSGLIWLDGGTFGTVPQVNPLPNVASPPYERGYIAEFPASGTGPLFSSTFGGSNGNTNVTSLTVDGNGAAYVAGSTVATDFPIAGSPLQSFQNGFGDGFVAQIVDTGKSNDVSIQVTPTAPSAAAGSPQTFNITVTNNTSTGTGALGVAVTTDLNLDSFTSPTGSCSSGVSSVCTFGTLAPLASATATATMTYPSAGTFTNFFYAHTDDNDPNTANNTQQVVATVANPLPISDIGISSSVNTFATVGAPLTFSFTVNGFGPAVANNIILTIQLPKQFSFVSSTVNCTGTLTLTCSLGALGADASINPQVTVTPNYPGLFTITGSVQDAGSVDPNTSDNFFANSITASGRGFGNEYYIVSDTSYGTVSAYSVGGTANFPVVAKGPAGAAISAVDISGRYLYVGSSGFGQYTSVVDMTVQREVARIHGVAGRPMVTTPDGSRLIARLVSLTSDALAVVDTSTFQIVKTISLDGLFGDQVGVQDLNVYSGIVANNKLYLQLSHTPVTGTPLFTTAVIDLGTFAVSQVSGSADTTGNVVMTPQQRSIEVSSDGTRVYALRRTPAEILVIDTSSDSVINTISLPMTVATSIVVTKDPADPVGQFAYISGRSSVAPNNSIIMAVDLQQGTVLPTQETVSFVPTNLVLSADGMTLHGIRTNTPGNNALLVTTADIRNGIQSLQEYSVGIAAGGLSIGFIDASTVQFAPSITSTIPASIDNSVPNTVSILGSNFAPGSRVKIGSMDPVTATFVSTGRLDVNLPALAPENQDSRIIVTLPNTQELPTRRNVSGIANFRLPITNAGFPLPNSLLLLQSGESRISIIDTAKNGVDFGTLANPLSVAMAPDKAAVYVSSPNIGTGIQAISLSTGQPIATIPLPNDAAGYQDALATALDPVDGKAVLYYTSGDNPLATTVNDRLTIVDADSTSGTYNQVKRVITTNDGSYGQSWALATSPSGRYVYSVVDAYNQTTGAFLGDNLIAYDTLTGTFASIQNIKGAFSGEEQPNHMRVSPDGNWIILPGADGSIKALNITGNPMLGGYSLTSITDAGHSYKTFQVVGSRLFALDANTNTVTAFNFLPASTNFSKLGSVTLPGPGSFYESPLLVEPTATYVYIALKDQDVLAVLDANKVASSDPTALLDQGGDALGLEAFLITTPVTQQVDLASVFTQAFSFPQGTTGAYVSATVSNNSVNTATNVVITITMPAGVSATTATYVDINSQQGGLCTGTSTVVCNLPALQGGDQANLFVSFTAPATTGTINFSMTATSTEADSNLTNNNASIGMTIVPAADLTLSAAFPSGPLVAGQHVTYQVTANNLGPATATGTIFVDVFGLNNQVITPPAGVGCSSGNVCSIPTLSPNTPQVFTVDGDVPPNSSLFLDASVNPSTTSDPDYSNNSASVTLTVHSNGVLSDFFVVTDRARGMAYAVTPSTLTQRGSGGLQVGVTPLSLVAMPNGRTAFAINFEANYISVIDATVPTEIYRIQGEPVGRAATLTSDASQLIVTNRYDNTRLDVFDTSTFALVRHINIAGITGNIPISNMFVAGTNLYLMLRTAGQIYVVNLTNDTLSPVASTQTYGSTVSRRFALTPDGSTLVAVGGGDPTTPATLYLINAANGTVNQTIALPSNTATLTVATTPNTGGNVYAYVTMNSTLQMLDLTTGSPTFGQFLPNVNVALPNTPTSSAITSDGVTLGLVQSGPNVYPEIVSIDVSTIQSQPVIASSNFGTDVGVITDVKADFLPPANAPQITSINPPGVFNNAAQTLQINGTNFSSDAVVKIGSANPVVPTINSPTQLTITLPAFTPSGFLDVAVINQNAQQALASRNVASPTSSLFVGDAPTFNAQYDTYTTNYGDGSVLSNGLKGSIIAGSTQVANPWGIAVTTGDVWYVSSYTDQAVESSLGSEGTTRIPLSGGTAYGDAITIVPDPTTGRTVALAPSYYSPTAGTFDWQLNVIDVDPYSPTLNTIIRSIPANVANAGTTAAAFAATPDGKFAYQQVVLTDFTAKIVVYNLTTGQATILDPATLGIDPFIQGMQASPDSIYLAVANLKANNIKVFNITSPTSPSLVATIPVANPNSVALTDCCNLRIVGNKLYAFDPGTMLLQAFNFLPETPDFSAQGVLQLPGNLDPTFQGGLAVSPDGAFVYAAEMDDDAVDVIDATKIAGGNTAQALLARFSTGGRAPTSIAINPLPTFSITSDLAVSVSHTPEPVVVGSNLVYTITVSNLGPSPSGQVVLSDVLPAGVTFVSATAAGSNAVSCSGTTVVSCSVGVMAANAITTVTLTASTTGVTAGPLVSTVQVGQSQNIVPDPNPANNVAIDTATVPSPDLTVTVTADNLAPSPGGTVTFHVVVTNNGAVSASNVVITSTLDAGTIPGPAPSGCSLNGLVVTCAFNSLNAGGAVNYRITTQMPAAAGSVNFTTTAKLTELDANPADNSQVVTVVPVPVSSADVSVQAAGAPVNISGVTTYTVVVTNNGPGTATGVTLTDTLDRFQFVSASSTVGACTFDGINVNCSLGTMANGASVTVNVGVMPPSSGWASNEFRTTSTSFDPVPTNNAANMGPFGGTIGNTKAGLNVLVDAQDPGTGSGANFLFSSVTKPGLTTVTSVAGTQAPAGYRFGNPARVYDLSTTAAYAGNIRVALQLSGTTFHHPNKVRLFHLENGAWVDRTASVDTARGLITGTTASLSPFIIAEPLNAVPVANAGADETTPGTSGNGTSVTLSGAASTDADSDSLTYKWSGPFPEGNGTVTGLNPSVTLPLGASKVTLVVNDGEADSAPAGVNVTVSDFLVATPTAPITLARGSSTSFNVALTPKFGSFDAAVTLTCGSLPAGVTCSFTNNSVTPGAQGATTTVTLTASASAGLRLANGPWFAFWLGGLPVFGVLLTGKLRRKSHLSWLLLAIVLLALVVGMVACGGGGNGGSGFTPTPSSNTSTITVTGTAGSLQHAGTATVVVQ